MTSIRALKAATAYSQGDPRCPVASVAAEMNISYAAARNLVHRARKAGLLPRTVPGQAKQTDSPHQPRTARWASNGQSWLACASCRLPWPCDWGQGSPAPDPQLWRITVEVPMSVGDTARDSLFTAVADAVYEWMPEDRDGWDPDVSAGPDRGQGLPAHT